MSDLWIRAAEPPSHWRLGALPLLQTSNPSGESAFPRPLRKGISVGTRERFALAGWQGVLGGKVLMLDRGCLGWDTCLCGAVLYELRRGWPDRVGSEVFP